MCNLSENENECYEFEFVFVRTNCYVGYDVYCNINVKEHFRDCSEQNRSRGITSTDIMTFNHGVGNTILLHKWIHLFGSTDIFNIKKVENIVFVFV